MEQTNYSLSKSKSLILLIISILAFLIIIFNEPLIKIRDFDAFKQSTLKKYTYVQDVNYCSHQTYAFLFASTENNNFCINIKTKNNLQWNEMKKVFLDTKSFLLSSTVQSELNKFYRKPELFSIIIEFDSNDNKNQNAKIEKDYDGKWIYSDYNGNIFEISSNGELKHTSKNFDY